MPGMGRGVPLPEAPRDVTDFILTAFVGSDGLYRSWTGLVLRGRARGRAGDSCHWASWQAGWAGRLGSAAPPPCSRPVPGSPALSFPHLLASPYTLSTGWRGL